ncbi:methyltransferase domain-containing protein [Novosphingobium flavum]|uniref:Methyltransferase domain-containing protein n=1 Tax=Novosphingobium flavum TaxID=1778672 RepID=A0A7X1FT49_9SPHN|nr:class I SAM-dependent methyltransferase [Novosphingobium flavum]MBC2666496.1 methyltransferase domain-containing protein [Novosphingobium flavum]
MTLDSNFTGSIPATYEECLVPALFAPYAADMVERAVALYPRAVLEIAAGTGVVSHSLAAALEEAGLGSRVVATDLNPAMLAVAAARAAPANLTFEPADAMDLPFADHAFDLVLAQFGVMFFPDKVTAFREVRRVLVRGGTFVFNLWDRLDANPGALAVHLALQDAVPEPRPGFLARVPYGHHDTVQLGQDLREAGFTEIAVDRVALSSPPGSAEHVARGLCLGSPAAGELAVHPQEARDAALAAATLAALAAEPETGFPMSALVVTAR